MSEGEGQSASILVFEFWIFAVLVSSALLKIRANSLYFFLKRRRIWCVFMSIISLLKVLLFRGGNALGDVGYCMWDIWYHSPLVFLF